MGPLGRGADDATHALVSQSARSAQGVVQAAAARASTTTPTRPTASRSPGGIGVSRLTMGVFNRSRDLRRQSFPWGVGRVRLPAVASANRHATYGPQSTIAQGLKQKGQAKEGSEEE